MCYLIWSDICESYYIFLLSERQNVIEEHRVQAKRWRHRFTTQNTCLRAVLSSDFGKPYVAQRQILGNRFFHMHRWLIWLPWKDHKSDSATWPKTPSKKILPIWLWLIFIPKISSRILEYEETAQIMEYGIQRHLSICEAAINWLRNNSPKLLLEHKKKLRIKFRSFIPNSALSSDPTRNSAITGVLCTTSMSYRRAASHGRATPIDLRQILMYIRHYS